MNARLPKASDVVCHLDSRYGGISSAVPALARATAGSQRYSVELTALCNPDEVIDQSASDGIQLRRLRLGKIRGLADVCLYDCFRPAVETSDVVHIHGIWQQHSNVAGALARKSRVPVVVSTHGMLESWAVGNKRWRKVFYSCLVERKNLLSSACLRALTYAEVDDCRRYGLTNPVAVVPNGVTPPANIDPDLFFETYPELKNGQLVLFLGRIHFKKGLDPLCRAWAKVSPRFPDAHLVLAGPDFENTQRSVESLVYELGIGRSVIFTGMLAGNLKWSALAAANLFVLPSYSEGFSVAILEAMVMGRAVLISNRCNFEEIAALGCGIVIQPDVNEIEKGLIEILDLPATSRDEMGARGKTLVESRYNWSVIGAQMADVYDWVRGGPKPSSVEICT